MAQFPNYALFVFIRVSAPASIWGEKEKIDKNLFLYFCFNVLVL